VRIESNEFTFDSYLFIENLKCLTGALDDCGNDKACRDALKKRADQQLDQCLSYGPDNPSNSPEYKRPCSANEIAKCKEAHLEFMKKYFP